MKPGPRLTAAERRTRLLDAALALFADRGYESASIGEIAITAGVTKPVLYDHFESKQDLYVELLNREAELMADETTARLDPGAELDVRLRTLAEDAVSFARSHPSSVALLRQGSIGPAEIRSAHEALKDAARKSFAAAILADHAFNARPGLTREASAELVADLHNAVFERVVNWAVENPATRASTLGDVFVDVLWRGLSGTD